MTSLAGPDLTIFASQLFLYNVGCEMIYLIHHRLQKIINNEAKLVSALKDITKSLYSDSIADLIEDSSQMLTVDGLRNMLYNVCHQSVIVLDP